jgi:hypothetical protein
MKNIHLLPTSQPSRLFIINGKLYYYHKPQQGDGVNEINQNIYITSNEEIKEGDWCYQVELNDNKVDKCYDVTLYHTWTNNGVDKTRKFKKIILTTDQDLIKYGVQAIDDEFLQWFVKNPSCENVEVEEEDYSQKCRECGETVKRGYSCKKGCFMRAGNFIPTDENIKYKIIIPKEKPKQETLEEVAEITYSDKLYPMYGGLRRDAFIEGAKWQMERSYSKEEVYDLMDKREHYWVRYKNSYAQSYIPFDEWFEQFKKK